MQLSVAEMRRTLENSYDVYLGEKDLKEMYQQLGIKAASDGGVSRLES